jgi:hypothetical protein
MQQALDKAGTAPNAPDLAVAIAQRQEASITVPPRGRNLRL